MYAFLFVLVPLATVVAWALARDRKRRHAHGGRHAVADPGCQGVRERAGRQVDVTRIAHDGRAGAAVPSPMPGRTGPPSRRRAGWRRSPVRPRGAGGSR